MLTSLDEKLAILSEQAAVEKAKKEEYDKKYQQALNDVQEKQKEPKIIQRPANAPKSGPTAAGRAFLEAREREREERERKEREKDQGKKDPDSEKKDGSKENDKDSMDVDDDNKTRPPR